MGVDLDDFNKWMAKGMMAQKEIDKQLNYAQMHKQLGLKQTPDALVLKKDSNGNYGAEAINYDQITMKQEDLMASYVRADRVLKITLHGAEMAKKVEELEMHLAALKAQQNKQEQYYLLIDRRNTELEEEVRLLRDVVDN
jgi:hypothetical protein